MLYWNRIEPWPPNRGTYRTVTSVYRTTPSAQEPEWLHCSHSAVHDGEWGESRAVSPEVHDHLHWFECVKLQVVKTAPDSQLLNLLSVSRFVTVWMRPISVVSSANFRSLTEGSLDVQTLVYLNNIIRGCLISFLTVCSWIIIFGPLILSKDVLHDVALINQQLDDIHLLLHNADGECQTHAKYRVYCCGWL